MGCESIGQDSRSSEMWLWAPEPCTWGYNQPFISVLGHLTHLHSASSHIMCFGQNVFLGGYQGCAHPEIHQFTGSHCSCFQFCPGLGSAGSMLMLLHPSLGCLSPSDPLLQLLFESNKNCHFWEQLQTPSPLWQKCHLLSLIIFLENHPVCLLA